MLSMCTIFLPYGLDTSTVMSLLGGRTGILAPSLTKE